MLNSCLTNHVTHTHMKPLSSSRFFFSLFTIGFSVLLLSFLVILSSSSRLNGVEAAPASSSSSTFPSQSQRPGSGFKKGKPNTERQTEQLLDKLTFDELVREMSQFDLNGLSYNDHNDPRAAKGMGYGWIKEDLVEELLRDNKVGSIFNSPSASPGTAVPPVDWYRKLQNTLWEMSKKLGSKVPILYGIDSIHGATYIYNATLFPQQIGVGASFNITNAHVLGEVCSKETRYAGIPWVFSPVLGIAVQPSWARVFETFGEDPLLASEMGKYAVRGYQQKPSSEMFYEKPTKANHTVAACAKHFVGYPDARTGRDRTPVQMPYNSLMQYFVPSFDAVINDPSSDNQSLGVLSIMENYIELNGKPVVASELLLDFLLRGQQQLDFQNLLVTDYNEIFNLADFHKYSKNYVEALYDSINKTSIDMAMVSGPFDGFPNVTTQLKEFVSQLRISHARVRESASRVLDMKVRLGLIGDDAISPVPPEQRAWSGPQCVFGCDEHRKAALDAARDSITLLQNDNNLLPLDLTTVKSVALIGQACDSKGLMSGGWTVHWQGTSNESALPTGSTVRQALEKQLSAIHGGGGDEGGGASMFQVNFSKGCNVTENSICGSSYLTESAEIAKNADVVILCLGERHYAEKPGDIFDMGLPGEQTKMVQNLLDSGVPKEKLVAVLVEGRPRLLGKIPSQVSAVVHSYLPGPTGGEAIVDVLSGKVNPSGKLPITYPKTYNGAPIQYWRKYSSNTGDDYTGAIQWEFGHGLSYTSFEYHSLNVGINGNDIVVDVFVKNTGARNGSEAVLVYSTQDYRVITPEVKMLRAFKKVHVLAGETVQVQLQFSYLNLAYFDETSCKRFQSSPFTILVGGLTHWSSFGMVKVVDIADQMCDGWGRYFLDHSGGAAFNPPVVNRPGQGSTQDYFISSIVCFGAGIVITVIVVSFIRKRREKSQQDGSLLEPASI